MNISTGTSVYGEARMAESVGPQMQVACWTLVGVSALFLALRIYCKFLKRRGLWWDDHLLVAAWVSLVCTLWTTWTVTVE